MLIRRSKLISLTALTLFVSASAVRAEDDFYKGKEVRL